MARVKRLQELVKGGSGMKRAKLLWLLFAVFIFCMGAASDALTGESHSMESSNGGTKYDHDDDDNGKDDDHDDIYHNSGTDDDHDGLDDGDERHASYPNGTALQLYRYFDGANHAVVVYYDSQTVSAIIFTPGGTVLTHYYLSGNTLYNSQSGNSWKLFNSAND